MAVTLPAEALSRYQRFSLYNSPYVAHDHGCAIDLYPDTGLGPASGDSPIDAPSPIAGRVLETRTVRAPPKPYAPEHDHLVLVDTGEHVARILHVAPTVEPGDVVDVGDSLGTLVRAGFFAPWVDNHVHLELRDVDANPYRASGSLPLEPGIELESVDWDGSGTVVEVGADVRTVADGDRVLVSGVVGCGACGECRTGWPMRCLNAGSKVFGTSLELAGGQAELVAVPAADTAVRVIPESIGDEQAVLLTDILPTGFIGARRADIAPGSTVAVIGLGPVGICALRSALLYSPARVLAVDPVASRIWAIAPPSAGSIVSAPMRSAVTMSSRRSRRCGLPCSL